MQVELKDLRKGDEVLIASGSQLIRIKLLRDPQFRKEPPRYHQAGKQYYKSIKCSFKKDIVTYQWNSQYSGLRTHNTTQYNVHSVQHNAEKYFDLNHKSIWLIRKNN